MVLQNILRKNYIILIKYIFLKINSIETVILLFDIEEKTFFFKFEVLFFIKFK